MQRDILKILLLCLMFFSACEKVTNKTAGCTVNGLWIGAWKTTESIGGTFFAPVLQDDVELSGNVYIQFDLPSLENYGTVFSGKIADCNLRSIIDISGVDIKITGAVENDQLVNGSFETTIGLKGTYNGEKIPTSQPITKEIYTSETVLNGIVYIDQKIWVFTDESNYSYENSDDFYYVVKRIDTKGNFIDTIHFPCTGGFVGNTLSFDGEKIWCYNVNKPSLDTYDTLGNPMDTFFVPNYYVDAIACIDNHIYLTDGYNRVTHIFDSSGNKISDFPNDYISLQALCEYKGSLLMATSSYNTILKTDSNGKIMAAFTLPENIFGLCTNGESIWCLSREYIYGEDFDDFTILYKIYELRLN